MIIIIMIIITIIIIIIIIVIISLTIVPSSTYYTYTEFRPALIIPLMLNSHLNSSFYTYHMLFDRFTELKRHRIKS